jgi:response regulator RpfG family c-di-GMP phosphodiesterase
MNKKHIVAIITPDAKFRKRAELAAQLFSADFHFYNNVEEFSDQGDAVKDARFVILFATQNFDKNDIAGMVQVIKFAAQGAGAAVVVEKRVDSDTAEFIKKSGASVVMSDHEFYDTTLIEYVISRKLTGDWISIKTADLVKDRETSFSVYHMMPLNGKFLAVHPKGQILTADKLSKYNSVGEMYIKRDEYESFQNYMKTVSTSSADGLKRRCRGVYLGLVESYKDLVTLLTDQSEAASFDAGKNLYQKMHDMATELISSLGALGEPWEIINNSAVEDFTAIDRAPAIASYAGILSLELTIGEPVDVMVAALIADIGLLELTPKALLLMKSKQLDAMSEEDKNTYKFHPQTSLNKVLSRKVPIPDKIKNIVMATHEKNDKTGFPNRPESHRIPKEAFLIQLGEKLDHASVLDFGKARVSPKEARKIVVAEEMSKGGTFPAELLIRLSQSN